MLDKDKLRNILVDYITDLSVINSLERISEAYILQINNIMPEIHKYLTTYTRNELIKVYELIKKSDVTKSKLIETGDIRILAIIALKNAYDELGKEYIDTHLNDERR